MVTKILFWSGFGVAVRLWQLGLQMRPLFHSKLLWTYPVYGAVGGAFGYWLTGVESRQLALLEERKARLLEKRRNRDQARLGTTSQLLEESQMATTS